jgi:cation diffusion facilitator family transporter
VTFIGILISAILAAVKIVSGLVGNSYALIADGIESIVDIFSSLIVLGGLRISVAPPNERFPYGYGKTEPLTGIVVAIFLIVAAAGIAIQSIREIETPHHVPEKFTLFVLIAVVIAKELMFRVLSKTGKTIGSHAMETDAWHHRSDALTSVAAFIGISVALVAGPGYEAADDWAALFASLLIAYNGVRFFRHGLLQVLDASSPPDIVNQIRNTSESVEDVRAIEKCRVRKSGLGHFVEIHVMVDKNISVERGHAIGHCVKDKLLSLECGVLDVVVHVEPYDNSKEQ